ncbi:hypothetical protein V8C26DRAFT_210179 [Trichoderma gracile]
MKPFVSCSVQAASNLMVVIHALLHLGSKVLLLLPYKIALPDCLYIKVASHCSPCDDAVLPSADRQRPRDQTAFEHLTRAFSIALGSRYWPLILRAQPPCFLGSRTGVSRAPEKPREQSHRRHDVTTNPSLLEPRCQSTPLRLNLAACDILASCHGDAGLLTERNILRIRRAGNRLRPQGEKQEARKKSQGEEESRSGCV